MIKIANTTKHQDTKSKPGGIFEPAHLIIPRYATAPANKKDGEMWYDVSNNKLKVNIEGSVKELSVD